MNDIVKKTILSILAVTVLYFILLKFLVISSNSTTFNLFWILASLACIVLIWVKKGNDKINWKRVVTIGIIFFVLFVVSLIFLAMINTKYVPIG